MRLPTGERIRDKIAASKQKGIWMGGVVPLGYRVESRALHIVEEHAELIRLIFGGYVELGSVAKLKCSLDEQGIVLPERVDGAGRHTGGGSFSRGHMHKILSNPIYAGRLAHKGKVHPGQHPAIILPAEFDTVQAQLAAKCQAHRDRQVSSEHLLMGRLKDDLGNAMTPTHAKKGPRRYRYYVSQAVLQGRAVGCITRISAPEIEALVVGSLRAIIPIAQQQSTDAELITRHLSIVTARSDALVLELTDRDVEPLHVNWSPRSSRRQRDIIAPPGVQGIGLRPMKAEDRARILKAIAKARGWLDQIISGDVAGVYVIAAREGLTERSVRMTLSLAHLSPSIVRAIIDGQLPRGIGIAALAELPPAWAEQHRQLGVS